MIGAGDIDSITESQDRRALGLGTVANEGQPFRADPRVRNLVLNRVT
jgi:hypothetical protein